MTRVMLIGRDLVDMATLSPEAIQNAQLDKALRRLEQAGRPAKVQRVYKQKVAELLRAIDVISLDMKTTLVKYFAGELKSKSGPPKGSHDRRSERHRDIKIFTNQARDELTGTTPYLALETAKATFDYFQTKEGQTIWQSLSIERRPVPTWNEICRAAGCRKTEKKPAKAAPVEMKEAEAPSK